MQKLDINEFLKMNTIYNFRFKSILLPPIVDNNPIEALNMIISYIHLNKEVSINDYEIWFFTNFSPNKGRAYNTRKILERANFLLVTPTNTLRLTNDCNEYLKMNELNKQILMAKNFTEAYIGFLEIVFLVTHSGEGGIKKSELFIEWNNCLSCNFNRTIGSAKEHFNKIMKYLHFLNFVNIKGPKVIQNTKSIKMLLKKL